MVRGYRPLLLLGLAAQSIGAFMQCRAPLPHNAISPSSSSERLRPSLRKTALSRPAGGCRMGVGEEEAIKSIKSWGGAPADSRLACSPASTDAGVIASFLTEALVGGKGNVVLITPNCESASDSGMMDRLAQYLASVCPWAAVKALKDAPQPCLSFSTNDRPNFAASPNSAKDLSKDQVMSRVLDWFTTMLINLDDEEEYIAIGRSLLSVSRYEVTSACSGLEVAQAFWNEVRTMAEKEEEGNAIIVLPDFMPEDHEEFDKFVNTGLGGALSWAGTGRKLEVSSFHPKGPREGLRSPWPLVQISLYDPAPPRQEGDLTAEDEEEALSFNAEMETLKVPADKLREASDKARDEKRGKGFGKGKEEKMPGFPLNLDELTGGDGK